MPPAERFDVANLHLEQIHRACFSDLASSLWHVSFVHGIRAGAKNFELSQS